MARANNPEDTVVVAKLPPRKPKGGIEVKVGKPRKIMTAALRRTAAPMTGGTTTGSGGNFYSPELSTDFLELPQSRDEQRSYYRHFYDYDPFVGQAIDQHEELPLSKLRLNKPKAKSKELAAKSMRFCEKWAKRIKLLDRLISIVHEYFLLGEAWIYCEDTSPDLPNEVRCKMYREITADGGLIERWEEYADADEREIEWLKKDYKGWTSTDGWKGIKRTAVGTYWGCKPVTTTYNKDWIGNCPIANVGDPTPDGWVCTSKWQNIFGKHCTLRKTETNNVCYPWTSSSNPKYHPAS